MKNDGTRHAAIDVGSNTLRLLIGSVQGDEVTRIYTARSVTRLAEDLRETGSLRKENRERSIEALKDFSRSIAQYGATRVSAVGTSALREAKNSREFVLKAYEDSGILIDIISGIREAELTARGVLAGIQPTAAQSLIIDIGGGSTEWIIQEGPFREKVLCGTVPLGVVNLQERFMKTDPPAEHEISALTERINDSFHSGEWDIGDAARRETKTGNHAVSPRGLIGTGGTITTLASLDLGVREYDYRKIHLHQIPLARLRQLMTLLVSLPRHERQKIDGLEPERADLIIPGILLTIRLMEILGFDGITVSDYGLLEGLLVETKNEEGL
ncbi:MAG TPA: hypothetical protein VFG09_02795 [Thermodesulfovibrionales bacterium]|nr:hypothetical protein [Thermodesulfovibrionales bacterium]